MPSLVLRSTIKPDIFLGIIIQMTPQPHAMHPGMPWPYSIPMGPTIPNQPHAGTHSGSRSVTPIQRVIVAKVCAKYIQTYIHVYFTKKCKCIIFVGSEWLGKLKYGFIDCWTAHRFCAGSLRTTSPFPNAGIFFVFSAQLHTVLTPAEFFNEANTFWD